MASPSDAPNLGATDYEVPNASTTARLKSRAGEWVEEGKERLQKVQGDFERQVATRPIASVLIAFGVGLGVGTTIGAFVARRSTTKW